MMRIQSSASGMINAQERLRGHHQGVPRDENTALKKQDFVCVRSSASSAAQNDKNHLLFI
jgi:hypothetical protein